LNPFFGKKNDQNTVSEVFRRVRCSAQSVRPGNGSEI